jgi:hypothetical protein
MAGPPLMAMHHSSSPAEISTSCACGGGCPTCQQKSMMRQTQLAYDPEPINPCLDTNVPPVCQFTDHQARTLRAVHGDARSVTQRALSAISRGDPYMATMAERVFHISNPDMTQIADTVAGILGRLRSVPHSCGSCADSDCYTPGVLAYTQTDLSNIIICQPRFFSENLVRQRRTLIHEAGHAFRIDAVRVSNNADEHYCNEDKSVECTDPCSNLTGDLRQNVDAWARFIECAAFRS